MLKNSIFHQNVIGVYGDQGKAWLENLSQLLQQYENELHIKLQSPFENLTFNYVTPAHLQNGDHVIFKCGVPNKELTTEIEALKHFDGNGIARLIDSDADKGWLIIERLEPGEMLSTLSDDDESTRIAVSVMQKLWKPIETEVPFPTIAKWLFGFQRLYKRFGGKTGPFPKDMVDRADKLSQELLQSMTDVVLLHGDLHHFNILSSQRGPWLAIDPKGVVGESEFEIAAYMKNPMLRLMSARNLKDLFARRIDIITEMTGFDRDKIIGWSFVHVMLSAWWMFEDNCGEIESLIGCANELTKLF